MAPTPSLTKDEAAALATRLWRSPSEFCRVILPDWFPSKMPWVHRGVMALRTGQLDFLLDFGPEWWQEDETRGEPSYWTTADLVKIVTNFVIVEKEAVMRDGAVIEPEVTVPLFALSYADDGTILSLTFTDKVDPAQIALMIPRGFSKTTLENAMNLRDCVYQEEKFIVYVSETGPHAERQLASVRIQLEQNDLLRVIWGDLRPDRQSSNKWTDTLIEPTNGTRLGAIGAGGQIRGLSKDAIRPTRITVDDLQTQESVKSDTQRAKDMDWFIATLLPARKLFGTNQSKIDVIGTLLHPEAIMAVLLKDPEWTRVRFGAIDRQGDPLWAYAMDHAALAKKKQEFARVGRLDLFDYEYMSMVPNDDGVAFPLHKIVHVHKGTELFAAMALAADPAISENPKADFFSLACLGMEKNGHLHLVNFFAEVGVEFDRQAELFFDFHFAHMASTALSLDERKYGIEAIAYQRALLSLVKSKQHEKSQQWGNRAYFDVIPITHGKKGKIMRVQGLLSPRVKAGHMSFERTFPVLEEQLRDWPNGKLDGPDSVAMALQLLDPYLSLNRQDPEAANDDDTEAATPLSQSRAWGQRNRFRKAP